MAEVGDEFHPLPGDVWETCQKFSESLFVVCCPGKLDGLYVNQSTCFSEACVGNVVLLQREQQACKVVWLL